MRAIRRLVCASMQIGGLCLTQAAAQLPPEAQAAGDAWLQKDCSVGEQDRLSPVLRKFKEQFEPFFLDALNNGPPPQLLNQIEATASKIFDLRKAVLQTGKGVGLSGADLEAIRRVTREQYIAQERGNFVISYKSRAVAGLGIAAGDRGKAALRALAADSLSPLQGLAREALSQLQTAPGKAKTKK